MGHCNRCRFAAKGVEQDTNLYCHRSPPMPVAVGTNIMGMWAAVHPSAWCGCFKLALNRLFRGHVKT